MHHGLMVRRHVIKEETHRTITCLACPVERHWHCQAGVLQKKLLGFCKIGPAKICESPLSLQISMVPCMVPHRSRYIRKCIQWTEESTASQI